MAMSVAPESAAPLDPYALVKQRVLRQTPPPGRVPVLTAPTATDVRPSPTGRPAPLPTAPVAAVEAPNPEPETPPPAPAPPAPPPVVTAPPEPPPAAPAGRFTTQNASLPNQGAPLGFDAAKWFGGHESPKYKVGRIIAAGGSIQDAAAAVGGTVVGTDGIRMPDDGLVYDAIYDQGGANNPFWEQMGGMTAAQPPTAPSATAAMGSAGQAMGGAVNPQALHPGTGSTEAEWAIAKTLSGEWSQAQANAYLSGVSSPASPAAPTAGSGGTNAWTDQIRGIIMQRLQAAQQPINEQDTGIAQAVSAARDETTRASEQERTALAERLYAQGSGGLQSGALTQQIQQSGERNASALSSLRGNLMMQAARDKAQELQQLLQLATASGDSEMARQVQRELAALQAALQREGLAVNLAEFGAQLNQNAVLYGLNG